MEITLSYLKLHFLQTKVRLLYDVPDLSVQIMSQFWCPKMPNKYIVGNIHEKLYPFS